LLCGFNEERKKDGEARSTEEEAKRKQEAQEEEIANQRTKSK